MSLATISYILLLLNPIIIAAIIIILVINSICLKKINAIVYKLTEILRKHALFQSAYLYMIDKIEYAKEIRLFGIQDKLLNTLLNRKKESNKVDAKIRNEQNKTGLFSSFTGFLQQILVYIYMIHLVIIKSISVGSMTIYLNAINQFSVKIEDVLRAFVNISSRTPEVEEFKKFMNIRSTQYGSGSKHPCFDENSMIEFKNVSFMYPGSNTYAIRNLSIKISGDEKLCIVGENGAGKTTFTKLLLRLYAPNEGHIYLNGIDISEYDYFEYLKLFSPVFQDYAYMLMTLKDNVITSNSFDEEKFNGVMEGCELDGLIPKLKHGIETQVGTWIDEEGFNPSGGEGQRMAIGRAVYKNGSIYILDEPTAALDPFAEQEIYTQFHQITQNKCAVIITHRLSAVQLGNKIAVFEKGQVVEYGSHAELYAKGGIYTEMFDKQAKFYRDEPCENSEGDFTK